MLADMVVICLGAPAMATDDGTDTRTPAAIAPSGRCSTSRALDLLQSLGTLEKNPSHPPRPMAPVALGRRARRSRLSTQHTAHKSVAHTAVLLEIRNESSHHNAQHTSMMTCGRNSYRFVSKPITIYNHFCRCPLYTADRSIQELGLQHTAHNTQHTAHKLVNTYLIRDEKIQSSQHRTTHKSQESSVSSHYTLTSHTLSHKSSEL